MLAVDCKNQFCHSLKVYLVYIMARIIFAIVWKYIWYYGIAPCLSPASIYVTVLPPWELNTAEIFKPSNVAILNLFRSYPQDFTFNLIPQMQSYHAWISTKFWWLHLYFKMCVFYIVTIYGKLGILIWDVLFTGI